MKKFNLIFSLNCTNNLYTHGYTMRFKNSTTYHNRQCSDWVMRYIQISWPWNINNIINEQIHVAFHICLLGESKNIVRENVEKGTLNPRKGGWVVNVLLRVKSWKREKVVAADRRWDMFKDKNLKPNWNTLLKGDCNLTSGFCKGVNRME